MSNQLEIIRVIDRFYEIISGIAGEERDWDEFESLFCDKASLMNSKADPHPLDVSSYIVKLNKFLETNDFYEYGLNYDVKVYRNIVYVYSEYEAKESLDDDKLLKKGVNLVHLLRVNEEWKIVSMLWEDE